MVDHAGSALKWDHQGRLTSYDGGARHTAQFVYGHNQSRVMRLDDGVSYYVSKDFEVHDGVATLYVRDGKERLVRAEDAAFAPTVLSDIAPVNAGAGIQVAANPDGKISAADAWIAHAAATGVVELADATSASKHLLRSAARRLLLENTDATVWLHHDHLGSVVMATGADGTVAGERRYHIFGNMRWAEGYVDAHGYTGQELDESTGLLHFDYRYLDPELGRWISVDPSFRTVDGNSIAKLGESTTAFAYVANNALNNIDPTGLKKTGAVSQKAKKPDRPDRPSKQGRKSKAKKEAGVRSSANKKTAGTSQVEAKKSGEVGEDTAKVGNDQQASASITGENKTGGEQTASTGAENPKTPETDPNTAQTDPAKEDASAKPAAKTNEARKFAIETAIDKSIDGLFGIIGLAIAVPMAIFSSDLDALSGSSGGDE